MVAAALALAASLTWGIADFLGGLTSRKVAVLTVMALSQPVGLVALGLAVAARGDGPGGRGVLWAVPAALLGTVGLAAFYRGMAIGTISVVAPIAAVGAAIPIAVGIGLGDPVSVLQVAGFGLAIGGVALASREPSEELGRARLAAGAPWGALAAVGFGGYFVPMHEASEADVLWAALALRTTSAGLLVLAVAVARPSLRVARAGAVAIVVIGLFDSSANLLFAAAASQGLVSVVSVLASLYPVVTVALAWLYLRERIGAAQGIGVAAALAGVGLVTAG